MLARSSEDLPTLGTPMIATSASNCSSSCTMVSEVTCPASASTGARFWECANRAFPLPPFPPGTTRTEAPSSVRSASSCSPPSSPQHFTNVPTGTPTTRSSPVRPALLLLCPLCPSIATKSCFERKFLNRCWPDRASTTTLPPFPPSPPSGPPIGTYFSLRKLMDPVPPLPPRTTTVAVSITVVSF